MVVQMTLDSAIHCINHYPPFEQLGPELQELYGQVDQGIEVYKSNYIAIILVGRGYFLLKSTNSLRKQPTNIS